MATGFEIAGVVLGAIPMIIEGIKLYRNIAGKSTRKGFLMTLETLTVELDTEHMILKNTCDIILYDIKASTSIKATGGTSLDLESWKEGGSLHCKIEERLGSSASSFRNTAQNMVKVIDELMLKLGYDDLIARLGRSNQRLLDLTHQSAELAPKTRQKARGSIIWLARGLLSSVYNALNNSLSCACTEPHGVNLQLENYPSSLLKHGDEEKAANEIRVHAVLSFDPPWYQSRCAAWHWEEIQIQKSGLKYPQTQDSSSIQLTKPRRLRWKEKAKDPSTECLVGMGAVQAVSGSPSDARLLLNLCERLGSAQNLQPRDTHGYLLDPFTTDGCRLQVLSVHQSHDNDWTPVSLKEVLLRRGERIPSLRFKHKVRLAPVLARSLLQLASSSWLPGDLTSEDIVFIQRPSAATLYDCVYVSRRLPKWPSLYQLKNERKFDLPSDYTEDEERVFSLGVLLMELVLGATWESLRDSATSRSDIDVAEECLPRVQIEGDHYYRAIKCCIRIEFESDADLDKATFRQDVYDKVVGLLEDNHS
ncbi:hypothetical protein PG984_013907 [Apiospora sp. TS-2023a]